MEAIVLGTFFLMACAVRYAEIEDVEAVVHLILVRAASGVENVRKRRRKRQRVHHCIALSDRRDRVVDLCVAAVIARFADQQEHAQAILRFVLEQLDRVVDRIQNFRSIIARLQVSQIVFDQARVLREIPGEINLAVELHDRDPGGPQSE